MKRNKYLKARLSMANEDECLHNRSICCRDIGAPADRNLTGRIESHKYPLHLICSYRSMQLLLPDRQKYHTEIGR